VPTLFAAVNQFYMSTESLFTLAYKRCAWARSYALT